MLRQTIFCLILFILLGVTLYFDVGFMDFAFDLSKLYLFYGVSILIFLLACIDIGINRYNPFKTIPVSSALYTFILISVISCIFSIHPPTAFWGTYKRYDGVLSLLSYVFIFYVVINYIKYEALNTTINVIILCACLASAYGICQRYGITYYPWGPSFDGRVFSTFGHPAFFSTFLIMVVPLVLYRILTYKHWYFYVPVLILVCCAFYYTRTRATFVGLVFSNINFFVYAWKATLHRIRIVVPIVIILCTALFYNLYSSDSITHRVAADLHIKEKKISQKIDGSTFIRFCSGVVALKIIYEYPVLGIGQDCLGYIYPSYLKQIYYHLNFVKFKENQNRIHNDFLDMAVSRGLVGLGVYIWLLTSYFRMVWRKRKNMLVVGLGCSILAYLIQCQFSLGHTSVIVLFWAILGMSVVSCIDSLNRRIT